MAELTVKENIIKTDCACLVHASKDTENETIVRFIENVDEAVKVDKIVKHKKAV